MRISLLWILAMSLPFSGALAAQGAEDGRLIVAQGSAGGAPACSSCHGGQLQGDASIKAPPLAGLPAPYIIARLSHYAGPEDHNPLMKQVAQALTPSERDTVAQYISRLPAQGSKPR